MTFDPMARQGVEQVVGVPEVPERLPRPHGRASLPAVLVTSPAALSGP